MNKYSYSVIRFVPSPTRDEAVNIGMLVGSDSTGEWMVQTVRSKSRAIRIDDDEVFPQVAAELARIETKIERFKEASFWGQEEGISEQWLSRLSRESVNVLQLSRPLPILADSIDEVYEMLWETFIVEPELPYRTATTRTSVLSRYWASLSRVVSQKNAKKDVLLKTGHTNTPIDVALHNGVARELSQCWSFQVKDKQQLLYAVKAWGFTIKQLRDGGGLISSEGSLSPIEVPEDVQVSVIFAPTSSKKKSDEEEQAFEVFRDKDVNARCISLDKITEHVQWSAKLVEHDDDHDEFGLSPGTN